MNYKAAFVKMIEDWKEDYKTLHEGQKPTIEDLAGFLGWTREHLQRMLGENYPIDEKAYNKVNKLYTAWRFAEGLKKNVTGEKNKGKSDWDKKKIINYADVAKRLQIVIDTYTQSDPMDLAKSIEAPDVYIKEVLDGKKPLYASFVRNIRDRYGVRRDWLLWGLGEMEEPEKDDSAIFGRYEPIPVLDIDIAAADANAEMYDDKDQYPIDYLYVPEFSGCTAVNVYSDSMEPLINKGSRMFIRKIHDWKAVLEYGQVYVVGLSDGRRFLKYVKRSKEDHTKYFLLVSHNKDYEEFEVLREKIKSIWMVDGWMNKHTQSTFHLLEQWALNRNKRNDSNKKK